MEERAIDRLRKFARYARDKGVVKGENSFEAYCELSNRYIYNSIRNGKGAIGTDIIARIVDKFPELNVKWLCTGKGNMIETDIDANLPETYQYFPIFTDIFTYNDTAFDTIFLL